MNDRVKLIYKIIYITLGVIIISMSGYVLKNRLGRVSLSREIFLNTNYLQGIMYTFLLLTNILLLFFLIKLYLGKEQKITEFVLFSKDVYNISKDAIKQLTILITEIPYIDHPISYMTHYFIKIPARIYGYYSYIIQILLMVCFALDVLYYERFFLSYFMVYLFLIELLIKSILYISQIFNDEVFKEISRSIVITNIEKAMKDPASLNNLDYEFTTYNTQLKSIQQAIDIRNLIRLENHRLLEIEESIEKPLFFQIIKRIYYSLIWGYIIFYYPFPLLFNSLILTYMILTKMPFIFFFSILTFLYYYLRK